MAKGAQARPPYGSMHKRGGTGGGGVVSDENTSNNGNPTAIVDPTSEFVDEPNAMPIGQIKPPVTEPPPPEDTFLGRHPNFLTKHPNFQTNHPNIYNRMQNQTPGGTK